MAFHLTPKDNNRQCPVAFILMKNPQEFSKNVIFQHHQKHFILNLVYSHNFINNSYIVELIHTTVTTIFSADQLLVWNEYIILILVKGLIMHQLTVFEMEEISGGALTDTLSDVATWVAKEIGAVALGVSIGAIMGTAFAGRWGGVSGGIFGIGSIGQLVGMISGVILGGVCFGAAAGIVGWDMTLEYAQGAMNAIYDGTLNFWSN